MSDSWKKKYSEYTRAVDCVFGWVTCICWEHRMVWWIVGALCCMNKTGRSFASLHFTPRGWGWGCRGTNTCRSSPHPVMDWKWTVVAVELLSHVWLFVTPWTVVCQVPLPMGFPRQEYWSGLPFPSPGGSSQPRDQTHISCIGKWILYHWATWEAVIYIIHRNKYR